MPLIRGFLSFTLVVEFSGRLQAIYERQLLNISCMYYKS